MEVDMKLSVEDSPNSAGVVVDAVRYVTLARARQNRRRSERGFRRPHEAPPHTKRGKRRGGSFG